MKVGRGVGNGVKVGSGCTGAVGTGVGEGAVVNIGVGVGDAGIGVGSVGAAVGADVGVVMIAHNCCAARTVPNASSERLSFTFPLRFVLVDAPDESTLVI